MSDTVFYKSFQYFRICNTLTLVYSALKIIGAPTFIFFTDNDLMLRIWLSILFVVSSFQLAHYYKVHKVSSNVEVYLNLAKDLNHHREMEINVRDPQGRLKDMSKIDNRHDETIDFMDPTAV